MKKYLLFLIAGGFLAACSSDNESKPAIIEDYSSFEEIGEVLLPGGEAAGEISAFDPITKLLFSVNNSGENVAIDIVDLSDPEDIAHLDAIDLSSFGGNVNSVAVGNGYLAAAVEATTKTNNGKVIIFDTNELMLDANAEPICTS